MDKWAVATKRQPGWALYEDAAEVMAGECGRRSESRCMTLFLLNPITWSTSLKSFVLSPKEKPAQVRAGFSLNMLEDRLEAPSGTDFCILDRGSCSTSGIATARYIAFAADPIEAAVVPRIGRTHPP